MTTEAAKTTIYTEDQINRIVDRKLYYADRDLREGSLNQIGYDREINRINEWADRKLAQARGA
jgi:hypothetical protein